MIFRNRIVDDPSPAPEPEFIGVLERALGCKLPIDYLTFLESCNGGYVDYEIDCSLSEGRRQPMSFCALYPLANLQSEALPAELDRFRTQGPMAPEQVLPIGIDGGGSTLFLDLRTSYRVVAHIRGLPAWTGSAEQDTLVEVARNFNEYFDALYISEDAAVDAITNFDPRYNDSEAIAKWLDLDASNWRTKHADIWDRHVARRMDG